MSPKTLFRQNGILVDQDNEPLKPRLKELDKSIEDAIDGNDKKTEKESKEEKQNLLENCKYLIDLRGKILIFSEPPERELWNMLKPILSHDSYCIEYPYVDRNDKVGIHTKRVVMQGFPACIFCSARDESKWPDWDQIVSRFLICSPTMTTAKYQQSNTLVGVKAGLPTYIQQQIVISENEVALARECYKCVRDEMRELTKAPSSMTNGSIDTTTNQEEWNPVFIPYFEYLSEALPAEKGADVRTTKIIFSLLNVVALAKSHLRPKMFMEIERCVIATLEDLEEVLRIAYDLNGMPTYKLKFLREILIPLYNLKSKSDQKSGAK